MMIFEKFDAVAELLKMKSEKPLVRMVDYLEKASIKEIDKDKFSTAEVLDILKEDLGKMRELATEIRNLADEAGDFVTVAEFEGHVEGYNKNLWFIEAMLTQ